MVTRISSHRKFTYKVIQWEITNFCNYDCFYCSLHTQNDKRWYKNWKKVVDYFNVNIHNSIFLTIPQLFGGEPTLHPDFWKICSAFTIPFGIYTNLSKPLDFWKRLLDNENLHHIYSTLHYLSVGCTREYLEKVDYISSVLANRFTLNIMLESNNDEILDIYNQYKCKNIICVLTKIPNIDNVSVDVTQDCIHKRQYFDITDNGITKTYSSFDYDVLDEINTRNFKCSTIKFFNNIDIDGNITNYCRRNILTTVEENEYNKINRSFVLCRSATCPKYCYVIGTKEKL